MSIGLQEAIELVDNIVQRKELHLSWLGINRTLATKEFFFFPSEKCQKLIKGTT